jgi:hypothetical protein
MDAASASIFRRRSYVTTPRISMIAMMAAKVAAMRRRTFQLLMRTLRLRRRM